MKIIVLVKQVPDTTEIQVDKKTGTLIRDGVKSIINPDDLAGLEEALCLKDKYGAHVSVLTMGPPQAGSMLKECLARGCDEAILLTDMKFAGSDTWATSNALAAAIKKLDYDLIIAGRQAIDGDTAQVGPQTAERLNLPQITYVDQIIEVENDVLTVVKNWEDHLETLQVELPCLITTLATMNKPRYMNCADIWTAIDKEVKVIKFVDTDLDDSQVGLKSSPTNVKRTFTKDVSNANEILNIDAQSAAKRILADLVSKQLIVLGDNHENN